MSKLEQLIEELCPDGVEYRELNQICKNITTGKLNANSMVENGIYPFYTCDALPFRINEYAFDTEAILISGNGSRVGHINYYNGKFNAYQRTYVLSNYNDIEVNFLLHYLKEYLRDYILIYSKKGSIPYITLPMLQNFKIPLPPLPVQREIVRILDNFTELTAELTAELEDRKKQYEYYRDILLTFGDEVEWKTLGDVCFVTKLAGYEFTEHVKYSNIGQIIALRGLNVKNGKLDLTQVKYIDESNFNKLSRSKLIIGDMLFTYVGTVGQVALIDENDKYYLAPNVALIRVIGTELFPKFMQYYFQTNIFLNNQINKLIQNSSMKNLTMEKIRKFKIPLPPLEEQKRIVDILDRFDTLCNDISKGLPAEIEARKKQYEYYRDKLLDFKNINEEV